jgi:tRNA(Ile)-lysidine synthase
VPLIAKERKLGIEEAGREARYAFFETAVRDSGCQLIATAHTQTDQAETVLLNVVRGAGLGGIAGIPIQRGNIIRPLLFASRMDTVEYCREQRLPTINDSTNADIAYARPRIREIVVPELEKINPRFEEAVARLAQTAGEEDRFLDNAAANGLDHCEVELNGPLRFLTFDREAAFDRNRLEHLPPVLLKRGIRLVVEHLGGKLDAHQTGRLAKLDESGSMTSCEGGVVLTWTKNELHVYRAQEPPEFKEVLRTPGDTFCDPYNWKLSVSLSEYRNRAVKRDALEVFMDVDAFRGPLHFRSVAPGDRMIPSGGTGHRKLSDLMGEARLTLLARKRLPIICDIIGPIWAPGVALADRVRVTPGSKKALLMVFAPISSKASETETLASV